MIGGISMEDEHSNTRTRGNALWNRILCRLWKDRKSGLLSMWMPLLRWLWRRTTYKYE